MKNLITPLIVSAVVLAAIFIGSSFSSPAQENAEIPRYHFFYPVTGYDCIVYDAVTGDYKAVGIKEVKQGENIREFLEK